MANYVQPVRYEYLTRNTYYQNPSITSVNTNYVPFFNNDASIAFNYCRKLVNVSGLNDDITTMYGTFWYCNSLKNIDKLPNSLVNLSMTFQYCNRMTDCPTIPNSVTNMYSTFNQCTNLVNAPSIPDNVINLSNTFNYCIDLNNVPYIGNSVNRMDYTFYWCNKLQTIPNIPSNVESMYYTFYGCSNLTGNIYIYSNKISSAYQCFGGALRKDVYFPYTYANCEISKSYDTFTAYYDENGTKNNVYLHDLNSISSTDWSYQVNSETNNATLIKYTGSNTSVSIPQYIE